MDAFISTERDTEEAATEQRVSDIWRRSRGITEVKEGHTCTHMCLIEPITGSYRVYGCTQSGVVHVCMPSRKQCPARYHGKEGIVFCVFSKAELFVNASRVVGSFDSISDEREVADAVAGDARGPGHTASQDTADGVKCVNAAMFPGPSVMWNAQSHQIMGGGGHSLRRDHRKAVMPPDASDIGAGTKSVSVSGRTMASRRGHGDPSVRRNKKLMTATVAAMGALMEDGWEDIIDSSVHDILVGVSVGDVNACSGGTLVDMSSSAPPPRISNEDLAVAIRVCRFMWKFQVVNRARYYTSRDSGMVPRESVAATLYRLAVGPIAFSVAGSCFVDDFNFEEHKDTIIFYPMGCLGCHLPSIASIVSGDHPWLSMDMIIAADTIQCDAVACASDKSGPIGDARAEFFRVRDRFDMISDASYDGKNRNIKLLCDARDEAAAEREAEAAVAAAAQQVEGVGGGEQVTQTSVSASARRSSRNGKRPLSGSSGANAEQTPEQLSILAALMKGIGNG